ncbi:MAG: Rhs element Vgr protein [Paraglaciecola sp.]|jgi:Rhs element Vgr protein
MSAPSPLDNNTALVTFTIKVNGKEIDSTYQVLSVNTWNSVNKVPKAQIILYDGSAATSDFELSDSKEFLPGNKVVISAGYNQKEQQIFNGIIVKQGIEINSTEGTKLVVELTDKAMKMSLARHNALFEKIKDSDLISKLIKSNGLNADVSATNNIQAEIVQYYSSDWDLMVTRAELNSLVVIVDAGTVRVKKPDTSQAPALAVKFGFSIIDLQLEMDAATQYSKSAIKSYSWDSSQQKLIEAGPGAVSVNERDDPSSSELADVFKVKNYPQETAGSINKASLQDWSSAELLRSMLAKIRGSVKFQGSALVKTGKVIQLEGISKRFNGPAFISGVQHSIYGGNWLTQVQVGLSPQRYTSATANIAAPGASGQLPPIKGLQTGIVKQIDKDPDGEFRVLVNMPILQDDSKGIWVRLGNFYASNKVGVVFYPEIKDEVVIGFMNEDPRYGVILGSLYSKKLAPPYPPDAKNTKKAIKTQGGLEILFDDKDKVIVIITPAKQQIRIDDKAGSIVLKDKNKNTVSLSNKGISLDSASNIKLTAKGDISLDAKANIKLNAGAKASMAGLQVEHKAKTSFSAKGSASAEVKASGILTLAGAMVKIN